MEVVDQFGRKVDAPEYPKRIISLVPSQTELLADFNLDSNVVGITRFCERPVEWFYKKSRVGGTKDPDPERIAALKPDLILGNAEENTRKTVYELEKQYPFWLSDVKDLSSAYDMMLSIGGLTHRNDTALHWVTKIKDAFESAPLEKTGLKVLYLIWRDPWMAVGRDTFIHSMIEEAGFENAIIDPNSRYPKMEESEIRELDPDLILLSSEPYPFNEEHVDLFKKEFNIKAATVDGALFSWYGTRLLHTPRYLCELQKQLT